MAQNNYIPTDRFLDVNCEPQRRLTPIQGYEKKDLVSLEEAVKPLEHVIQNIQAFVWTATGNCENPLHGLTSNERAAIYLYTMESDVKCLVYRGVKADISQDYPKGKKFVWWGLSSCTTSLDVLRAEQFLGKTETRTLFNIECFNGKNIQNHSQFPNENEVLLLPCSYFEVLSELDQGNGLHIVHIKQIEPPVTLIQPPSSSFVLPHLSNTTSNIESMNNNFTRMNVSQTVSSSKKTLELNVLKEKPRLSIQTKLDNQFMAANDEYLLFSISGNLVLIDKQGQQKLSVERNFDVNDICWSSYLNQFLFVTDICSDKSRLYSLDINASEIHQLKQIKRFDEEMRSCTCYKNILMISSKARGEGSIIEEYNLSNWKLKTTFKPPISCKIEQAIHRIQFNSNGCYLGVLLIDEEHGRQNYHWCFQLRHPDNMNILQTVSLSNDRACSLVALPNEQFLVNTCRERKELFWIDSDGQLKEIIDYKADAKILVSTVLIGTKCLVIATDDPARFHFYDL